LREHAESKANNVYWVTPKMHLSEAWLAEKSFIPTKVGIEIKRL